MREVKMNDVEKNLEGQISEYTEPTNETSTEPTNEASQYIGTKLTHKIGGYSESDKEADAKLVSEKKLTRIGEKIGQNAEIRDGWMDVDRNLFGERIKFYPQDWQFRIRPATVEAIRNWSTIDDENPNSIDDVFNEILKTCFAIITPSGPIPWSNLRSWDRFFVILLIHRTTINNIT